MAHNGNGNSDIEGNRTGIRCCHGNGWNRNGNDFMGMGAVGLKSFTHTSTGSTAKSTRIVSSR